MSKDSFVMYASQYEAISVLQPLQRAELFDALFRYVIDGKEPDFEDRATSITFLFIKQQIDRDSKKYEETTEKRKNASKIANAKRWGKKEGGNVGSEERNSERMQTDTNGENTIRTEEGNSERMQTDTNGENTIRTKERNSERMQTDTNGENAIRTEERNSERIQSDANGESIIRTDANGSNNVNDDDNVNVNDGDNVNDNIKSSSPSPPSSNSCEIPKAYSELLDGFISNGPGYFKNFNYKLAEVKCPAWAKYSKKDKGVFTAFFSEFNRCIEFYNSSIKKIELPKETELKLVKQLLLKYTLKELNVGIACILKNDYCNGKTKNRDKPANSNWIFRDDVFSRAITGMLD